MNSDLIAAYQSAFDHSKKLRQLFCPSDKYPSYAELHAARILIDDPSQWDLDSFSAERPCAAFLNIYKDFIEEEWYEIVLVGLSEYWQLDGMRLRPFEIASEMDKCLTEIFGKPAISCMGLDVVLDSRLTGYRIHIQNPCARYPEYAHLQRNFVDFYQSEFPSYLEAMLRDKDILEMLCLNGIPATGLTVPELFAQGYLRMNHHFDDAATQRSSYLLLSIRESISLNINLTVVCAQKVSDEDFRTVKKYGRKLTGKLLNGLRDMPLIRRKKTVETSADGVNLIVTDFSLPLDIHNMLTLGPDYHPTENYFY